MPSKIKQYRIRECSGMECGQAGDDKPVVPRVKILSWESKNRRRYLPESVKEADYEDINVNLNHPDGPNKQRVVQERFGWFENVTKEADGLRGDLHYNPELPYAKPFAWWVKNKPDKLGMSHDAVGTGKTENGVFIVERAIPKSVDLVADPASTSSLFESRIVENEEVDTEGGDLNDLETHIKNAVAAIVGDSSLDLKDKTKKIRAALKLLEDPKEGEEETDEEEDEEGDGDGDGDGDEPEKGDEDERKAEESLKALATKYPGVRKLFERVDRAETALALREKNEKAHQLCEEAKLPSRAVTATFLEQLLEAKDEKSMRKLIEDRKAIVSIQKPRSNGPAGNGGNIDNKTFAKTIREGR